jgi:hypothetical protein
LKNEFIRNCSLLADVKVSNKGINETLFHACISKRSTIAALNMQQVIANAMFLKIDAPKSGRQTKQFRFEFILILKTDIERVGNIKLTVGYTRNENLLHYCVTAIKKVSSKIPKKAALRKQLPYIAKQRCKKRKRLNTK